MKEVIPLALPFPELQPYTSSFSLSWHCSCMFLSMNDTLLQDIIQRKSVIYLDRGVDFHTAVRLALRDLLLDVDSSLMGLERFTFRARLMGAVRILLEEKGYDISVCSQLANPGKQAA